jgi:hypothetical protein
MVVLAIEAVQRDLPLLAKVGQPAGANGVILWVEPQCLIMPPPEGLIAKFLAFQQRHHENSAQADTEAL